MNIKKNISLLGIGVCTMLILSGCAEGEESKERERKKRVYKHKYDQMLTSEEVSLELSKKRRVQSKSVGQMVRLRGQVRDNAENLGENFYGFEIIDSMNGVVSTNSEFGEEKICLIAVEDYVVFKDKDYIEIEGFIGGGIPIEFGYKNKNALVIDVKNFESTEDEENILGKFISEDLNFIEVEKESKLNGDIEISFEEEYIRLASTEFKVSIVSNNKSDIKINKVTFNLYDTMKNEYVEVKSKEVDCQPFLTQKLFGLFSFIFYWCHVI
ncbi:MAG: hypothetical protein ACRC6T_17555 [Sarcina sp.]